MTATRDPHAHLMYEPGEEGYAFTRATGERAYRGLFVTTIADGPPRLVKMRQHREGGMREFLDPITDEYVGCCGCNWAWENVKAYVVT